jgi:hypothetical protein
MSLAGNLAQLFQATQDMANHVAADAGASTLQIDQPKLAHLGSPVFSQ